MTVVILGRKKVLFPLFIQEIYREWIRSKGLAFIEHCFQEPQFGLGATLSPQGSCFSIPQGISHLNRFPGMLKGPLKLQGSNLVGKAVTYGNKLPGSSSSFGPCSSTCFENAIVLSNASVGIDGVTNIGFQGMFGILRSEQIAVKMSRG
jgi:hypothetical protein